MNYFKKLLSTASVLALSVALTACSQAKKDASKENNASGENGKPVKVTMITDQGGVNDKSFNQSAYEGLDQAQKDGYVQYRFIESHKEADYSQNLETALDDSSDLIVGIGFSLYKPSQEAAEQNAKQKYVVVDNANLKNQKNLLGLTFADNENSFLVGYIAGLTSKTGNVGFIGGVKSEVIDRFDYGFKAGVLKAAKELNKKIEIQVQYADSFADSGKGKSIANQMYQKGADVLFHAAGGTGEGVIASAVENNKWVIGVDRDQKAEAPKNMLVSTVKGVGSALQKVCKEYKEGKFEGGKTINFGLKDGDACTIAYADNDLVSKDTKDKVEKLKKEIIDGTVKVPQNEKEFKDFGYDK